jgi:hypothetical protein
MGKQFRELSESHMEFIRKQKMFFVATAPMGEGRINLSPKGYDTLRIVDASTLLYLDFAGSGNETAIHIYENKRITLMWCSFDESPLILRAYGDGSSVRKGSAAYLQLMGQYFEHVKPEEARRIIKIELEAVQTSCGFGVPLMEYVGDRPIFKEWNDKHVAAGTLDDYIAKNSASLDEKYPVMKK